jgi:RNA polymerase sigma-70 factor (ECF subfamily)
VPTESIQVEATEPDPADDVVLADTVGIALQVVLDRLAPAERVAFVLHDSFGVDFELIASMLDTTPVAARKLASRARAKVRPAPQDALADWEVVDAFMAAAREGDFTRLLELLAPDVVVSADAAASALGTPTRLQGADEVAGFFNGAAKAAFPVFVEDRPGAAWIHRGEVKVVFDFTIEGGQVRRLQFRAADDVLAGVRRREGASTRQ